MLCVLLAPARQQREYLFGLTAVALLSRRSFIMTRAVEVLGNGIACSDLNTLQLGTT